MPDSVAAFALDSVIIAARQKDRYRARRNN
jgi:hypothetical protein